MTNFEPLAPDEYVRLIASLHESLRVQEIAWVESLDDARMLRERGHGQLAEKMERAVAEARQTMEECKELLGDDWDLPHTWEPES
jgi:hypothetical protein